MLNSARIKAKYLNGLILPLSMNTFIKEEIMLRKEHFIEKIRDGAIFIHPTDTIYGIGCNALNSKAVEKIRKIKKMNTMPFSVIAPSKEWIHKNCVVTGDVEKWLKKLPGRITLILKLKNKKAVSKSVNNSWDTIGVRIPKNWFSDLVAEAGVPFVTTSANVCGEDYMKSVDELDVKIRNNVNFIIYSGDKKGKPSRIIDLTKDKPSILRR